MYANMWEQRGNKGKEQIYNVSVRLLQSVTHDHDDTGRKSYCEKEPEWLLLLHISVFLQQQHLYNYWLLIDEHSYQYFRRQIGIKSSMFTWRLQSSLQLVILSSNYTNAPEITLAKQHEEWNGGAASTFLTTLWHSEAKLCVFGVCVCVFGVCVCGLVKEGGRERLLSKPRGDPSQQKKKHSNYLFQMKPDMQTWVCQRLNCSFNQ